MISSGNENEFITRVEAVGKPVRRLWLNYAHTFAGFPVDHSEHGEQFPTTGPDGHDWSAGVYSAATAWEA